MSIRKNASPVRPRPTVRPPPTNGRTTNHLLTALPADDFRRVRPHLTTVPLRVRQVVHQSGEPLRYVYFLNGGVASIATLLLDGTAMAAVTVGDEGMLGVEAMLGLDAVASGDTQVQMPDTSAEMMSTEAFRQAITELGVFRDLVGRYLQVLIAQMLQSAACHARHNAQQRCARCLLMTHDRMHQQHFTLSH
jgi:CRP-like cAMP-binding protein